MPIRNISLLLCLSLMQQASSTTPVSNDTNTPPKAHRLTKQKFLYHYGTNDTARALIHYYFQHRKLTGVAALLAGVAASATGYAFHRSNTTPRTPNAPDVGGGFYGAIFLALLGLAAALVFFITGAGYLRFSRRSLLKQLQEFKRTKHVPEALLRNAAFQKFLK